MNRIIFLLFLLIASPTIHSQKALSMQGKKIKEDHIFFMFDGKDMKIFDDKVENASKTGDNKTFSLKENYSNLYFKWLNPLKFRYNWKDTSYNDERDDIIKKFTESLVGQFGSSVSGLTSKEESKSVISKAVVPAAGPNGTVNIPADGFNNVDLTLLFLQIRANQGSLTAADITGINALITDLKTLDRDIIINYSVEVDKLFKSLLDIDDPADVKPVVASCESEVDKFETNFKEIETSQKGISKSLAGFSLSDALLFTYTKTIISKFLDQVISKLNSDKDLISKLKPVFLLFRNSIKNEAPSQKGYYAVRTVEFERGKVFETVVSIQECEYNSSTKEMVKKTDLTKSRLTFKGYDVFVISVSTGIFYASTKLKGFGVSNDNNAFKVSEDNIEKNTPVTAAFLNFNIAIQSRFLSPLIQLGVDPGKKRPFFLLGGGFSIPVAHIAFSAGGVWTWQQTLTKLSVGQTISSTTDLEKDVKYKFEMEPKGWYLGIQYNF